MTLIERINSFINAVASDIKSLYADKVNKTDVIAVAQGGTGGTDAETARNNLGLGTAAIKNAGTSADQVLQLNAQGKALSINLPLTITDSNIEIDGTNVVYLAKSNPDKLKTVIGLADYCFMGQQTGIIVFKSANKSNITSMTKTINILGSTISSIGGYRTDIINTTILSFTPSASVSSNIYNKTSFGTVDLTIRTAFDSDGKFCILVGDVNTKWSHPSITLLMGFFNKPTSVSNVTQADLMGWTSFMTTDISAMTSVVIIPSGTSTAMVDWSNVQNKSTPDFSSVTSGSASYKKGWRKLTATLPSQAGEITVAHGVTTVETVQAKVTNSDGIIIYNNDIDPTNQFYVRVNGANLILGVTANSTKVFGKTVTIYVGEEVQ